MRSAPWLAFIAILVALIAMSWANTEETHHLEMLEGMDNPSQTHGEDEDDLSSGDSPGASHESS